ncbi:hypothetical protein GOBAR_AA09098 [Gossypium barbadense]|uniref:Uncharacterized protein n=1 Tax=Gossypium barbadense TaxID=3634 RepID=A0A2P5Y7J6_GOSBA|nr:hypothetical protein GOBAR_AA09098 [Gossypium barbadense]
MVPDAFTHPSHQGADGAEAQFVDGPQRSLTINGTSCQWCPMVLHIRGTKVSMFHAPTHLSSKVPILSDALAQPRAYVTDGVQGYRTSKHQGADATAKLRACVVSGCTRLPHDQGPKLSKALIAKAKGPLDAARCSCTTKGLCCRWCVRLPHDQGPKDALSDVPEALIEKWEESG